MDLPKNSLNTALEAAKAAAKSTGQRRRFSTRNTVSGVLVGVVAEQVLLHGLTWPAIALAFVAVLPLIWA